MEIQCPVCMKQIEIPERNVFGGGPCRCRKCWARFSVLSVRPLRLQVLAQREDLEVQIPVK